MTQDDRPRTDLTPFPDPIPGSEHGEVWYALTRAEWNAKARGLSE